MAFIWAKFRTKALIAFLSWSACLDRWPTNDISLGFRLAVLSETFSKATIYAGFPIIPAVRLMYGEIHKVSTYVA